MPQVIISLPTAIFPLFAHFLNLTGPEEVPQVPQPPPPPPPRTPTPRRSHSRPHRRVPPSQTTPRQRLSRHNLRNRRGSQRNFEIPRETTPQSNEIPLEYPFVNQMIIYIIIFHLFVL